MLARPEYADYWTLKWGDLLRINRDQLNEKGMWSFYNWLRTALRENRPIDEFVRDIVCAIGDETKSPPAFWYREVQTPENFVDDVSQVVFNAQPGNVEWVFVDGRVLKERGKLVGVDAEGVITEANRVVRRVRTALLC